MASTKLNRKDVDRFTASAVANVSKNTSEQQKVVDEWNAKNGKKPSTPAKKK
jgi:hypothetical protein